MNPKTERTLRRITQEVAAKCGIEKALVDKPDPQQAENKEKAKEVLARTHLVNDWSVSQNAEIASQMQKVIDEPVRFVKQLDPDKQYKYDRLLEYRIKKAVRLGELPDPRKDKDARKLFELFNKNK